jgi:sec-independent protein translocase protein TatC
MEKKSNEGEMTFLEHLEELRWHIIRSVLAIAFFAIVAYIYSKIIFDYILLAPKNSDFFTNRMLCKLGGLINSPSLCINNKPLDLINISMSGQFSVDMMVSMVAGLIIASPFVFWEFWRFIAPALHQNERKNARGAVFAISFLFILGIVFGYYMIVPFSLHFLGTYSVSDQIKNQINLTSYFSTVASVTLASGFVFELPILAYFFSKIGLLTPQFMRKYRKHAIIVILIIAAIITPPDVFSQTLVSIPLIALYEVSIVISAIIYNKRNKIVPSSD